MEEKYLPLGTIVLLKEAKKRMMIVGYEAITQEEESKIYDYVGCLYPEGVISPDRNLLFNHEQIDKIFFKGFSDEEDIEFKKVLKNLVIEREKNETTEQTQEEQVEIPVLNSEIEVLETLE